MKKSVSKHRKSGFRARKTLQKFGYRVMQQRRALFSIIRLLLSKTQLTLDIMSKVRIYRFTADITSKFRKILKKN